MNEHQKEVFYRSSNFVTKAIVDAACGGSFIDRAFQEARTILDQVSKINRV